MRGSRPSLAIRARTSDAATRRVWGSISVSLHITVIVEVVVVARNVRQVGLDIAGAYGHGPRLGFAL